MLQPLEEQEVFSHLARHGTPTVDLLAASRVRVVAKTLPSADERA